MQSEYVILRRYIISVQYENHKIRLQENNHLGCFLPYAFFSISRKTSDYRVSCLKIFLQLIQLLGADDAAADDDAAQVG